MSCRFVLASLDGPGCYSFVMIVRRYPQHERSAIIP